MSGMKSAYELAMERLDKEDPKGAVPLSEEQKTALQEIQEKYRAKIAERECYRVRRYHRMLAVLQHSRPPEGPARRHVLSSIRQSGKIIPRSRFSRRYLSSATSYAIAKSVESLALILTALRERTMLRIPAPR